MLIDWIGLGVSYIVDSKWITKKCCCKIGLGVSYIVDSKWISIKQMFVVRVEGNLWGAIISWQVIVGGWNGWKWETKIKLVFLVKIPQKNADFKVSPWSRPILVFWAPSQMNYEFCREGQGRVSFKPPFQYITQIGTQMLNIDEVIRNGINTYSIFISLLSPKTGKTSF